MKNEAIIYGRISWKANQISPIHHLNKLEINELPLKDDTFPFISKDMFSIASEDQSILKEQAITFAAIYNDMLDLYWEKWLEKFESILKKLYWTKAKINVSLGKARDYFYEWQRTQAQLNQKVTENRAPLIPYWCFASDGPRSLFKKSVGNFKYLFSTIN